MEDGANRQSVKIYLLQKKLSKMFGGSEKVLYICIVNKQINFS